MVRIKEFETKWVRISLLCEDGKIWYVREIGMAGNEHDTLQTFQTKEEAEKEYNRLQELLRDNGEAIMETHYVNGCPIVW